MLINKLLGEKDIVFNKVKKMQLPQRHSSHRLERASELFFEQSLPEFWTAYKPVPDYGVDLVVDIFDEDNASGRELLVQLKASEESNVTANGAFERVQLNISTYNLLWDKLQVVMIVKYIASEDMAYWQLLSEVPEPTEDNSTMTIHIPRENVLQNINWVRIRNHIEVVHLRKLGARTRHRFSEPA
ncbi:conserved hypothetical protein [Photobacterium kishitanii]|nr:conserved hypothetical protein [Photobacterium kishitanii]